MGNGGEYWGEKPGEYHEEWWGSIDGVTMGVSWRVMRSIMESNKVIGSNKGKIMGYDGKYQGSNKVIGSNKGKIRGVATQKSWGVMRTIRGIIRGTNMRIIRGSISRTNMGIIRERT